MEPRLNDAYIDIFCDIINHNVCISHVAEYSGHLFIYKDIIDYSDFPDTIEEYIDYFEMLRKESAYFISCQVEEVFHGNKIESWRHLIEDDDQ